MAHIVLLLLFMPFAVAYTVPMTYNVTATANRFIVKPVVTIRVGDVPGADVVFGALNYTPGALTTLTTSSCVHSSFCLHNTTTAITTDVAYVRVYRFQLAYTVVTAPDNTFAFWPGTSLWPIDKKITYCPYMGGFVFGDSLDDDSRCFDRIGQLGSRTWLACADSPMQCRVAATYNGKSVAVRIAHDSGNIELSPDLVICDACILQIGDFAIPINANDDMSITSLVRPRVIVNDALPSATIIVGILSVPLAYTWVNNKIYLHEYWNHDGSILSIDFIFGAIILYMIKVWYAWIHHNHSGIHTFTPRVIYFLSFVEVSGSLLSAILFGIHVFSRDLADRFYRISTIYRPAHTEVLAVLMLVVVIVLCLCHIYYIVDVHVFSMQTNIAERKFCFEINMLLALALIIIKTHLVGFINILLLIVGVLLLHKRHHVLFTPRVNAVFIISYMIVLLFTSTILFNPLITSISGFAANQTLGCVYVAMFTISVPYIYTAAVAGHF